jgi:hypothetical protein
MSVPIDFYAPIQMPAGHMVYGAAAANHRAKLVGGWNQVFSTAYQAGFEDGMKAAYQAMMHNAQRRW